MILYILQIILIILFSSYFVFRYLAHKSTNFDEAIQYGINYTIAGALSVFILFGLIFYYYRERQYISITICLVGLGFIIFPYLIGIINTKNQHDEFTKIISDWSTTVEDKVFTSAHRGLTFNYTSKTVTGDQVIISETENIIEVRASNNSFGKIQIFSKNPEVNLIDHLKNTYPQCQFSLSVDDTKEQVYTIYSPTCPRISQYPENITTQDTFITFNNAPEYYLYFDIPLDLQSSIKSKQGSSQYWWETIVVTDQI